MSISQFHVINQLIEDRDLVLDFLAFFARFEYALKRAGFLKEGPNGAAQSDWDRFSQTLRDQFSGIQDPEFSQSRGYLLREPPERQVVVGQHLGWAPSTQGPGECQEAYVLRLVRTVRNNLFHGGKYPWPDEHVVDAARNRRLLESSLVVLNECLALNTAVRERFLNAA